MVVEPVLRPFMQLWDSLVAFVPGLVGAIIVLIIGYLVASAVHWVIEKVLTRIKADRMVARTNIASILGKGFRLSHLVGLLAKWYVFILFLPPAADLIKLLPLAGFLNFAALWIPNVIAAVLVGLIGLMAADYVATRIYATRARTAKLLGDAARVVIIIFTVLVVLRQIGVAIMVAEQSWLILLSGAVFAAALAIGIGFGLALKDEARGIIKRIGKRL